MDSLTRTRHDRPGDKHVLVIALAFPPSATPGAVSAAHMAAHLGRHGWFPTFLTIRRDRLLLPHAIGEGHPVSTENIAVHRTAIIYPWQMLDRLVSLRRRTAPAERSAETAPALPAAPSPRARGALRSLLDDLLRFPDPQCGWLPFAVLEGLAVARRRHVDCLYSSAPPWTGHLVALVLRHVLRTPWIAEFRDPWVANPWHAAGRPWPLGAVEERLEARVLASADMVVARTSEAAALLAGASGRGEGRRFVSIPGAYDPEEISAARRLAEKAPGMFVVIHAGRFYGPRSPVPLLTAIARLSKAPELAGRLELCLVGERSASIQALASRLGMAHVLRQVGLTSHLQTMRHILESDVAVVVQPATGVQIPSKVYEYLGCGVPILALTGEGATARLVRQARAGTVVAPDDIEGIRAAIRRFSAWEMPAEPVGPDPQVVGQFEASVVIGQVASLLDAVSDAASRSRQ